MPGTPTDASLPEVLIWISSSVSELNYIAGVLIVAQHDVRCLRSAASAAASTPPAAMFCRLAMLLPPTSGVPASVTPGAMLQTMPGRGRAGSRSSTSVVSVTLFVVVVTSMTGLPPVTVTDSSRLPIFIVTSTFASKPTGRRSSLRMNVVKPPSSNLIV